MFKFNFSLSRSTKNIKSGIALSLIASSLFGAGYILPNGTILYDDTPDHTLYRIDKVTAVQSLDTPTHVYSSPQTNSVMIEDRVVTYDRPVIVRERVIDRGPVYDIVDATGTILVYGLMYDALVHGFYHYGPHMSRHHDHFDHYRR